MSHKDFFATYSRGYQPYNSPLTTHSSIGRLCAFQNSAYFVRPSPSPVTIPIVHHLTIVIWRDKIISYDMCIF
jgi:hypothetical protein